ncbi:MAG TPA: 2-oxo-4-hydroxy-4-carboxy-5-ureidoimidazoline decarboxylase [Geminicoccaceae bacterium]|nr:2-oxo-4-hydroxy-4-carboxy-5-ureidoimidazoline decarboxylase [Geminicoccaceae bacterium]
MPPQRISIAELPHLARERFVELFGGVFEHAPWVAEDAFAAGPFASVEALHGAMVRAMRRAPRTRQLALIRAHPDLAGRAAIAGELTAASRAEQASAGLDQCTPAEFARFGELNERYKAKFGFPFILAVKGRGRAEILAAFERRLTNPPEVEFAEALDQVAEIARLRLADLIQS